MSISVVSTDTLVAILSVCDENADELFRLRVLVEPLVNVIEHVHESGAATGLD